MFPSPKRSELIAWVATATVMTALYAGSALVSGADLFGVNPFRSFDVWPWAAGAAILVVVIGSCAALNPRRFIDRQTTALMTAALSWPVFWALRTNWLNADGNMLTPKLEADVPRLGAHLTHDELLELFLHSRVWHYTHEWWGWSVVVAYQVVSCTAGALFIYALVRLARRLAPAAPWLFVAGVLAGGYMQLFFGDVENYTVTAAIVAFYTLAALRFLAGEVPLWVPAATLAVAAGFHLESAWLWPSAVYLAVVSYRRRRSDASEALVAAALACAILAATFVYFQFHGLPLMRFFSSHAGHALRMNGVFAIGMPLRYYGEQLELLLLLCPAVVMVVPLVAWRRFGGDEITVFLGLSALSMLLLQAIWRSQIGVLDDWNLYSIGGMLTSLFVWRAIAGAAGTRAMRVTAAVCAAVGWLHSYAWIVMNHRHGQ
jgi:hypothetical protein